MEGRERYSRGYIPHIDAPGLSQFVTWRLKDALPPGFMQNLNRDIAHLPEAERKKEYYRRMEIELDAGHGSQLLKNPVAAKITQDSLIFGHPARYLLHAWAIMPTHVHCLLTPADGWDLERIFHGIKSFTSHEIGKALNRTGSIWQTECFDRYMRGPDHFRRVAKYIEWNPVKAKLCASPCDWAFSSANPVASERLKK